MILEEIKNALEALGPTERSKVFGGGLDDFLREEGVLETVEAAAHQRVADMQKGGKSDSEF